MEIVIRRNPVDALRFGVFFSKFVHTEPAMSKNKRARTTRHALVNTYKWRKGDKERRERESNPDKKIRPRKQQGSY